MNLLLSSAFIKMESEEGKNTEKQKCFAYKTIKIICNYYT